MNKFIRFGIVGSIGFLVDASVLIFLVKYLNQNIYISKIFSFLVAVFVTWILNRSFTFEKKKDKSKIEYFLYLIIQSIGAVINYIIFVLLINYSDFFKEYLILPLSLASIIVMFFNYFTIKNVIYK